MNKIVGYKTGNGQTYCISCVNNHVSEQIDDSWKPILRSDEYDSILHCDQCTYGIVTEITEEGRNRIIDENIDIDFFDDDNEDDIAPGYYYVYGSFHDHSVEEWNGPFPTYEDVIYTASEDYLKHCIEWA